MALVFGASGGACGGKVGTQGDAGAPGQGDEASIMPTPSSVPTQPPVPDSGPADCAARRSQLDQIALILRQCCLKCSLQQCNVPLEGTCCPFSVSSTADPANQAAVDGFNKASAQWRADCYATSCVPTTCNTQPPPSNVCDPATMLCS